MVDESITELERAIAINPQGGYAYLQLVFLHTLRGNYERAETVARQAIELQERFISGKEGLQIVGAHTRLGYVYYCQGRYEEALREYNYEMAFLLSSDHALRDRAMIELDQKMGAAYFRRDMKEESERHFKSCCEEIRGVGGERLGRPVHEILHSRTLRAERRRGSGDQVPRRILCATARNQLAARKG